METRKKTESITGTKAKSKLPRSTSTKLSSAKGTISKPSIARNTAQVSKPKTATITSLKLKQTQNTKLPKNMKRMSVAKVSEVVTNHFHDENLKTIDDATESVDGANTLAKEITTKRVPLKEHFSQAPEKPSGNLPKKSSMSDLQPCTAFGGIRFTAKRNTHKKEMFQKMTKEAKSCPTTKPPESCTKEQKTSTEKNGDKEIEGSSEENSDELPTATTDSSKAASLTVKESSLKICTTFGGMKFTPKWQSTPLKPELFENTLKVSKHDNELHLPNSSPKGLETIPNAAKTISKEVETITVDETIVLDETIQPQSEEKNCLKSKLTATKEVVDKLYPAFAGMRIIPKRKSTHPKPDIFPGMQEKAKLDGQESPITGSSAEMKAIPVSTVPKTKVESQLSDDKLQLLETQKSELPKLEASKNVKTVIPVAFGGMRFKPRQKILRDVF